MAKTRKTRKVKRPVARVRTEAQSAAYELKKAESRSRSSRISIEGRDIGDLPPIRNPDRRARAEHDFRYYCETYHPERFPLPWSDDHLTVLATMERCVLAGDLFALAMPRGSGKTTLAECAIMWGGLYGRHRMIAGLGATKEKGGELAESIKIELENNDLLLEDFPEVCYPIRCLEGIANRCAGQLYHGQRTYITWTKNTLVFPTIEGSTASGVIIKVGGLTGGDVRGMKHTLASGEIVRPTLALIDDPQTDKTANSASQCDSREMLLRGAVLGMAGPGKKIAAVMPCTVIRTGDVADRVLDRAAHPDWNGIRTKLVYEWPTATGLWDRYAMIRGDSLRAGRGIADATEFYRANQPAMDAGARVAWAERFDARTELSALQHAMNLKLRDPDEAAFYAEYQNEPLSKKSASLTATVEQIIARTTGRPRGQVPMATSKLTGFIDVHDKLLFWAVVAWEEGFTGQVVDYGTFPEQHKGHYSLANAQATLPRQFPGCGADGAIQAGLEALVADLLARNWQKAGGGITRIDRLLVDMGYKAPLVAAVKLKAGGTAMMLSRGVGIRAGSKPISMYQRKPGWTLGLNWYVPNVLGTAEFPHVCIDVNYWKSQIHEKLLVGPGDPGAMTLYGTKATNHELFAQHLAISETWTLTHGHGRDVQEWQPFPSRPDNHWFDCLVGCAAAASMLGVSTPGQAEPPRPKRKRYTQADLQRR